MLVLGSLYEGSDYLVSMLGPQVLDPPPHHIYLDGWITGPTQHRKVPDNNVDIEDVVHPKCLGRSQLG